MLGEDKEKGDKGVLLEHEQGAEKTGDGDDETGAWERNRVLDRRTQEVFNLDLDRGLAKSPARKRIEEDYEQSPSCKKRGKMEVSCPGGRLGGRY